MWKALVRGTEWQQVVDSVGPSFFDVLPPVALRRATGALAKGFFDERDFVAACNQRGETLAAAGLEVRLGHPELEGSLAPDLRGQRVLEVYFHQLFAGGPVLLDLCHERFTPASDGASAALRWAPGRLFYRFDPDFLEPIQAVYAGFYDDDQARFDGGLLRLGLDVARESFLEHFGSDPRSVTFDVATFTDAFQRTFVTCRGHGVKLHRDFVALGLYLATLYTHLEHLGRAFDVRDAFETGRRT